MSGEMVFTAAWGQKGGQKNDGWYNTTQHNVFYQRFRAQLDITASEALNGVVFFEIGDTVWGKSSAEAGRSQGGGIGADGVTIEVRRAYLDWIPPHTDLKVRIGIQGFATPSFVQDSNQIFSDDIAGITLNYQFTPNVATTVWWFRPYSDNNKNYEGGNGTPVTNRHFNEMDMFGLSVPLTFDGVKVTPWGMYASIGRNAFEGYAGPSSAAKVYPEKGGNHWHQMFPAWQHGKAPLSSDGQGNGWWAGLTGEITAWNPFRLAFDFNYGSVDMGTVNHNEDMQRAGWYASILAEYKLDFMTPGLAFWYGSGDDSDSKDGSEMLPTIKADSKLTSFGQDAAVFNTPATGLMTSLAGTWGVMLQLKDISFVEDLKHTFRVAYYRGTNDKNMTTNNGGRMDNPWEATSNDPAYLYMTDKDSAWEFNLDTSYEIYKNLAVGLELGYIRLDISESAWGRDVENQSEDMYKIGVGLRYTF